MPIVVSHQPSALGIGELAFQGGLGQFRKHQQEMALRNTALALQKQQQDQGYMVAQQRNALEAAQLMNQRDLSLRNQFQQADQFNRNLAFQGDWRNAQIQNQQDAIAADQQRQQFDWEQRTALHEADFNRNRDLTMDRDRFEADARKELLTTRLSAEGEELKARIARNSAAIEKFVKDPALKEQFKAINDATGNVDWGSMTRPQSPPEPITKQMPDGSTQQMIFDQKTGQSKWEPVRPAKPPVDPNRAYSNALDMWKAANEIHAKVWENPPDQMSNPEAFAAWQERVNSTKPLPFDEYWKHAKRSTLGEGEQPPPQPKPPQNALMQAGAGAAAAISGQPMNAMDGSHPQQQPQFDEFTAAAIPGHQGIVQEAQEGPPEVREAVTLITTALAQYPTVEARANMPPAEAQQLRQAVQLVNQWRDRAF